MDGRRLPHHDFSRAEPFRPPLELFEDGQASLPVESFALQRLSPPNTDGRRRRGRRRRTAGALQPERHRAERRRISETERRKSRSRRWVEIFRMPWGKERVQLLFRRSPPGRIARTDCRSQGICPPDCCPEERLARKAIARTTKSAPIAKLARTRPQEVPSPARLPPKVERSVGCTPLESLRRRRKGSGDPRGLQSH